VRRHARQEPRRVPPRRERVALLQRGRPRHDPPPPR
jgi:hypothetical protein